MKTVKGDTTDAVGGPSFKKVLPPQVIQRRYSVNVVGTVRFLAVLFVISVDKASELCYYNNRNTAASSIYRLTANCRILLPSMDITDSGSVRASEEYQSAYVCRATANLCAFFDRKIHFGGNYNEKSIFCLTYGFIAFNLVRWYAER